MLEIAIRKNVNHFDIGFIIDVNIALSMMIIGAIYIDVIMKSVRSRSNEKRIIVENYVIAPKYFLKNEKFVVIFISIFTLITTASYIHRVYGSIFILFNQRYGLYNVDALNSLLVAVPLFSVAYILLFNNRYLALSRFSRRLVQITSLILIVVFMLGGLRNLGVMMAIAFIWNYYAGNKLEVKYLLAGICFIIVFSAVVAVGREYGLINFIKFNVNIPREHITRYILAISEGEFGTMRRVHEYSNSINYNPIHSFGYSYTLGAVINMIPGSIYHNRPLSIAVDFTRQYWGNLTTGTIGLGFSPILEAKLNFDYFWGIVFVFAGMINRWLHFKFIKSIKLIAEKMRFNWFIFIGALSSVSLNFYRMDFALSIKFFLIILAFTLFLKKLLFNLYN